MEKEVIFRVENLCKSFGITKAVQHADINFCKGEVHALIGENGSGKSTVSSMMMGINKPDDGVMYYRGEKFLPGSITEANDAGIAILMQEMNTLDFLSIAENIYLGREKEFTNAGILNKRAMNAAAQRLLEQYGLGDLNAAADIGIMSFEDRKIIEIIKAMNTNPQILIVDETTTALSAKGRNFLYRIMEQMRDEGKTIVFISHDLSEIIDKSDSVTVLRDGVVVHELELDESIDEDKLKLLMIGRELESKYYREDYDKPISEEVVLKVNQVSVTGELKDISFELHRGEVLGVGGLTSSGMHELGKVLYGSKKITSGSIECNGVSVKNIASALKAGIAYTSKNRDQESLMIVGPIRENICLPSLRKMRGLITKKKLDAFAVEGTNKLDVKMTGLDQYVLYLSGGNKQKVVLATWICYQPNIMVLDCPTRGIDVKVKAAIYRLIEDLTRDGISIIMISEELVELIGMSDRILILNNGEISGEFMRSRSLSEEMLIGHLI